MTYFKLVTSIVIASIIAMMGFVIKTQYDTIKTQESTIASHKTTVTLEGIGSHADGQILEVDNEYERNIHEDDFNNSDDSNLFADFDRVLSSPR